MTEADNNNQSGHTVYSIRLETRLVEKIEEAIERRKQEFPFDCNRAVYLRGAVMSQLKQDGVL